MASFTSSAGTKRVRPWDSCQDVEKLKEMLEDRQAEMESFKKQSALETEGAVKKLRETLQEKDAHIEQLMLEIEKSRAASVLVSEAFPVSSNVAPKSACVPKTMPAFSKGFSSMQNPSENMVCDTEDGRFSAENVCISVKKKNDVFSSAQEAPEIMKCGAKKCQVMAERLPIDDKKWALRRRHASPLKSKRVTADSEEGTDCDKELASDSTDDDDYTEKESMLSADSTDDEEYTAAFTKQPFASHVKAKKTNIFGNAGVGDYTGKVENVLNLRSSIQKQIVSQMVYRSGLKYRTSKAVAEVPNLSEAHMKAILGDDLFAKASRKGKLIQVKASNDDIRALFHGPFTKRLRYGAFLTLCDGLKFAFTKATGVLKVTGAFSM